MAGSLPRSSRWWSRHALNLHTHPPALARFLTGLSRAHCAHLCGGGCWSGWAAGSSAWSLSSTDKAPTREAVDAMPPTDARLRPCPVLAVGR